MKRYAFRINVPTRDGRRARLRRCGGHISWPTSVASQTLPPVRVPWPYGITVQLVPSVEIDSLSHVLARSLLVQFNPCTEQVPWASPAFQARITRDARSGRRNCFSVLAHMLRFRPTCGQNGAIENLSGRDMASGQTALLFHVKQSAENLRVVPFPMRA